MPSDELWPEHAAIRTARSDKRLVSLCPQVPAGEIIDNFAGGQEAGIACIAEDGSKLATAANLHSCTPTCVKYAKKGPDGKVLPDAECRFAFGKLGKDLLSQGFVKNAEACVYSTGAVMVRGVRYEPDSAGTPEKMLAEEVLRAEAARENAHKDGVPVDGEDDDFDVHVRRGNSHINSYNWAISQCTRSNIDLKAILGNGQSRGLVFYCLLYSTKSSRTVSTMLPLFAEVLSRIDRGEYDSCDAEVARKLVQKCLCKLLSGEELGAPAAVSKIMGWSDSLRSHTFTLCPTIPVIRWLHKSLDAELLENDHGSEHDASDEEEEVTVRAVDGKLTTTSKAPEDYINRCDPQETSHPLYSLSYFSYTRMVRSDKRARRKQQDSCHATESRDDSHEDALPPRRTYNTRPRYPFQQPYKPDRIQVLREKPAMLNIMCEIPLEESQPDNFGRLILILFKPFFCARDLLPAGSSSWHSAYTDTSDISWDPKTKPFRANAKAMQKAKRSANKTRKAVKSGEQDGASFPLPDFFFDRDDSDDDSDQSSADGDEPDESTDSVQMSESMKRAAGLASAALRQ